MGMEIYLSEGDCGDGNTYSKHTDMSTIVIA